MNRPSRARFVHRVDIHLKDTERTDGAAALANNGGTPVRTNVPCLISSMGGGRRVGFGMEYQEKRVRVLFPDDQALTIGHALVVPGDAPRVFTVDTYGDDENLGLVYFADCQEQPPAG